MIVVRPFEATEWSEYRDLCLRALKDSPEAFSSTYDRASLVADTDWSKRLDRVVPERDLPLAAIVNGSFTGLTWARIEPSDEHLARLYQMWVAPEYRGIGIGRKLLQCALDWAKTQGAAAMVLGVTSGESSARKLYESVGFTPIGVVEPLRPASELRVETMELRFDKGDTSNTR